MLTFFRRIRKGLIGEGSARKYLLYAVGEILLVMIGILLALQVNNWNQKKIEERIETNILKKLSFDLVSDRFQLERIDSFYHTHLDFLKDMRTLYENSQFTNEDILKMMQLSVVDLVEIIPQRTAYDEMLNSGNIYRISNNKLVEDIISYYQKLNRGANDINEAKAYITPLMNGLHMTDYWLLKLDKVENIEEKKVLLFQNGTKTQTFKVLKRMSRWGILEINRQRARNLDFLEDNKDLADAIQTYLED